MWWRPTEQAPAESKRTSVHVTTQSSTTIWVYDVVQTAGRWEAPCCKPQANDAFVILQTSSCNRVDRDSSETCGKQRRQRSTSTETAARDRRTQIYIMITQTSSTVQRSLRLFGNTQPPFSFMSFASDSPGACAKQDDKVAKLWQIP